MFGSRTLVLLFMIALASISRFLPHPPNFTPILAIALFAGARLGGKTAAFSVTLLAMLLSDLVLGFHDLQWLVYGLLAFSVLAGQKWGTQSGTAGNMGLAFGLSVLFFLVTNFFVWLTSGMYSLDSAGLVQCYTMAVPFFQNSLVGDLFYSLVLFGSLSLLEKWGVVQRTALSHSN